MRARFGEGLLLAVVAAFPAVAALRGAGGPLDVTLNLGPGDGPYTFGFTSPSRPYEPYEIVDRVATHWTSHRSTIELPLSVSGAMELRLRASRPLGEAWAEILFEGETVDRFRVGKRPEEHRALLGAREARPLRLEIRVEGSDERNLGLRLDRVDCHVARGGRVALRGGARWRAPVAVALLVALLLGAGWVARRAALLVAPWALAATLGLIRDPWLTHRLLTGVPEALAALGLVGLALAGWLKVRERASPEDVRRVVALALATLLLRALAVNRPGYYYPDLMLHVRLVKVVRDAGPDFLRAPAHYLWALDPVMRPRGLRQPSGLSRGEGVAYYGMPYSLAFHAPFAFWGLTFDGALTALKLAGAVVSTLPVVLLFALARRFGASPLCALFAALAPAYAQKLAVAALPALFGHAVDLAFLLWLAAHLRSLRERRVFLAGAGLVAATHLAYVSGTVNASVLLALLALLVALGDRSPDGTRRAGAVLGIGLAGAALSLLAYYRDFLGTSAAVVAGALASSGQPPGARTGGPGTSGTIAALGFPGPIGMLYVGVAVSGLVLLWRRGRAGPLLPAWILTYAALQLLKGLLPDVFRFVHDLLLVTPVLCLGAGEALATLAARGGRERILALTLLTLLALAALRLQWQAFAGQMGNAL